MKQIFPLFFILFILLRINTSAQYTITAERLKKHVYVLASDSLEGREAGSIGGKKAIEYVVSEFKNAELKFYNSEEKNCFTIVDGKKITDRNTLSIGEFSPILEKDYVPLIHSYSTTLLAKVVFVGYGIQTKTYNDYSNVDVKGKWVLIFRGKPLEKPSPENTNSLNYKIENAVRNGAAGILFVSPYTTDGFDTMENTALDATIRGEKEKILLLKIKRSVADTLLKYNNTTLMELERQCEITNFPFSFELKMPVQARVSLIENSMEACNVIGFLEGSDPKLKNEIIVVGAHHDHLGKKATSANQFQIFYGADDNASGTAGVIELANAFSVLKVKSKRSILFVTFDSEENGIVGSSVFLQTLPKGIKKNQIKAMINMDMIGRYKDVNTLTIIGSTSSKEGRGLVEKYAQKLQIPIVLSNEASLFYSSDHINFYDEKIPVFFLFTGRHSDYHTPSDTADKIDFEGITKILNFTYMLIDDLANRSKNLHFKSVF